MMDFDGRLNIINSKAEDLKVDKPEDIKKLISLAYHLGTMKGRLVGHHEAAKGDSYQINPKYFIIKTTEMRSWYDLLWQTVGERRKDDEVLDRIRKEMKDFLEEKERPIK